MTLSQSALNELLEAIRALPAGVDVVAAGTSCRHQIEHLTGVVVRHPVEIVADALHRR